MSFLFGTVLPDHSNVWSVSWLYCLSLFGPVIPFSTLSVCCLICILALLLVSLRPCYSFFHLICLLSDLSLGLLACLSSALLFLFHLICVLSDLSLGFLACLSPVLTPVGPVLHFRFDRLSVLRPLSYFFCLLYDWSLGWIAFLSLSCTLRVMSCLTWQLSYLICLLSNLSLGGLMACLCHVLGVLSYLICLLYGLHVSWLVDPVLPYLSVV